MMEWNLRSTADESKGCMYMNKLLGKSNWDRKKRKNDEQHNKGSTDGAIKKFNTGEQMKQQEGEQKLDYKTALFVEYKRNGELAARLRELTRRLAPVMGFAVKVVERT